MIVVSPNHHPEADRVWREVLGGRVNGARVLGAAQAKYLAPLFDRYDMLVTYASNISFDIPNNVKRIAVCWHQNWPKEEAFKTWQRVNVSLRDYEVDYFCNEHFIVDLIREGGGRAYYLPRFIDTTHYPKTNCTKTINTLWLGNRWRMFKGEYQLYCQSVEKPLCIDGGWLFNGEKKIRPVKREQVPLMLAKAKTVWAIGVSQLEAQFYGCEIVSYRGDVLPFYDENTIREYTKNLLDKIWTKR